MRVLFNFSTALKPKTGVGHYIESLCEYLLTIVPSDDLTLFPGPLSRLLIRRILRPPAPRPSSSDSVAQAPAPLKRLLAKPSRWARRAGLEAFRRAFQLAASRSKCDLYHEPNFIPWKCDLPAIATIHDLSVLLYPQWHPLERARHHESNFLPGLHRCVHLIAPSHTVRREMIETLHLPAERITAVHQGVRPIFRPLSAEEVVPALKQFDLEPGYLLHVGTIEPRKNLLLLMKAYCDLPANLRAKHPLVLIGGWGWRNEDIREFYAKTACHAGVRHIGYVPDSHLAAIYNGARALVFPSHYEGFGFPPLEMMACGGAVITSTAGSVREIMPRDRTFLHPDDLTGWRDSMKDVLTDDDNWNGLRCGAIEHARHFTWERCARETWNAYEIALNPRRMSLAA